MSATIEPRFVGRFAPSPTGPLHLGSLLAAIGSYLDARSRGGRWLVRLDDLDRPRNAPGAADAILRELERLGLDWDAGVQRQSEAPERYHDALERLSGAGLTFACGCSRRDLVAGVYPGHCRDGIAPGRRARSLRFRVPAETITVDDAVQGHFSQRLAAEVGDFVLLRADRVVAYHLATVVDDAAAGVTDVIRGADLLASTPRQVLLQRALGLASPRYGHLPVLTARDGRKLSKQNRAPSTEGEPAIALWRACLRLLGQADPELAACDDVDALRRAAIARWRLAAVPARIDPLPVDALASSGA